MNKSTWKKAQPKHTFANSIRDTLCLLHHYKACEYEVMRSRDDGAAPTLRKWIKSVCANTCYIVHLKSHALLQCCSVAVLQCCSVAVLQCCSVAVSQRCDL